MDYLKVWSIAIVSFGAVALSLTPSLADEPLANESVSFGQWEPTLDRLTADPMRGAGNVHELAPAIVTIKAGGAVNFIISGLHNVQVYDDGTRPQDIGTTPPVVQPTGPGGGIIDVPTNRIYRGPNPTVFPGTLPRDRVEVVHFAEPGIYLVICGVRNHFVDDKMLGYVKVLPRHKDK
jgi:hypothetical protein